MILASSRTTHESLVLSKPPACIHGISGYTHAKHEEHDTSCTATEASSWPIIFLRCQVINTAMLVVFWWSSWMIMDNHNFWEALGNSPNKETRRGNKAVFDNTVPYPFWNHWSFLPSDWFSTARFIGGQCVLYICYDVTFSDIKNRIRSRGKAKHTCTQLLYGNFF